MAKRYVLAKNCLKERIGNQGKKLIFLDRRHISTSGFASTATEMAVFAFFARTAQLSVLDGTNGLSAANHVRKLSDCAVRIETGSGFSHNY